MTENKGIYAYCTLFDRNYLDRGIVTVSSLLRYSKKGRVYILSMDDDDTTYRVLSEVYRKSISKRVFVIKIGDFLDESLKRIKFERNRTEFCWSCSAYIIDYVLKQFCEDICTYIDADMCFYSNPDVLVDEMIEKQKSVQIIEHRFRMNRVGKKYEKTSGRFCVEFNTFKNDDAGLKVLSDWKDDIFRQCSTDPDKGLGDQFYLSSWPEKYDCISVLDNLGAGVAPWNLDRYRRYRGSKNSTDGCKYVSFDRKGKHELVFFHFHGMRYVDQNTVKIAVFQRFFLLDTDLVYMLYVPYIKRLESTKRRIEDICKEFGINSCCEENNQDSLESKKSGNKKRRSFIRIYEGIVWRLKELFHNNGDYIDVRRLNISR